MQSTAVIYTDWAPRSSSMATPIWTMAKRMLPHDSPKVTFIYCRMLIVMNHKVSTAPTKQHQFQVQKFNNPKNNKYYRVLRYTQFNYLWSEFSRSTKIK